MKLGNQHVNDEARKVFALAQGEAKDLNHEYVGPEHVLLALMKMGAPNTAKALLLGIDVDYKKVRAEVEKAVKPGPCRVSLGDLPLSPRAEQLVQRAIEAAQTFNHTYVGTEHLLFAMSVMTDDVPALVLTNLGIRPGEIEDAIRGLVRTLTPEPQRQQEVAEDSHQRIAWLRDTFSRSNTFALALSAVANALARVAEAHGSEQDRALAEVIILAMKQEGTM